MLPAPAPPLPPTGTSCPPSWPPSQPSDPAHPAPRRPQTHRTLTTSTLLRISGTQPDILSRLPLELGLFILELLACDPTWSRRRQSPALGTAHALGEPASSSSVSSTRTLCACALVCRYWARLALDDRVWRLHYIHVVARNLFHVDPYVLHPMCDFTSLPRPRAGYLSTAHLAAHHASQAYHDLEPVDPDAQLSDRDLVGLLLARADLGVLDAAALHSLQWCVSLPPHALTDAALVHRRMQLLDHLMRTTFPHWLAPYPPLNFRWLSKWKYACAVAQRDTRRVVLTWGELVRLCFYMHFNDWDSATRTQHGGVFPGRLAPTHVSVFCADGLYRTTYYPPDSPIRLAWHWVTDHMDKSVVADPPFVRQVEDEVEMSEDDDDDESSESECSSSSDDGESDTDTRTGRSGSGSTASDWSLRPLLPVGPMAAATASGTHTMPAAMAHARYTGHGLPPPRATLSRTGPHGAPPAAVAQGWLGMRASLARVAPLHARFLRESKFIGRPELPLASTQHHRHRECLLQVENYLPLTVSRNPDTGQWIMLNRYYIFESLQHPVGPGIGWTAIADQHPQQRQAWSHPPHGYPGPPTYPLPPAYPHY